MWQQGGFGLKGCVREGRLLKRGKRDALPRLRGLLALAGKSLVSTRCGGDLFWRCLD